MRHRTYVIVANQPGCSTALLVKGGAVTILSQGSREWTNGYSHGYAHAKGFQHKGAVLLPAGNATKLWATFGHASAA